MPYTVTLAGVTVPFNWSEDLAASRRAIALAFSEAWRQLAAATGPAAEAKLAEIIQIGEPATKSDTPGALIKAIHASGGTDLRSDG